MNGYHYNMMQHKGEKVRVIDRSNERHGQTGVMTGTKYFDGKTLLAQIRFPSGPMTYCALDRIADVMVSDQP